LVKDVNAIYKAIQNPINKNNNEQFSELKSIFEKSLAINKDLPKGHLITFEDLEAKKPKGCGIDALKFQDLIGMKVTNDMKQWDFINENDLTND
jgi:N,N'-diacetyllegionaminate synthase